ncbi:MAG: cyclic nucleotide-binding domain-containing protein, partial [Clostridiales bacterium]|nr:cyclic nucleotide-binding domain-containing protein [Clostridiales bacterium]
MSIAEKSFRNSEVIIREGETGFSFFQILEGGVFVYAGFGKDDQIKLATLEEGEYFGEMAILE